jgi:hypothetical protein
MEQKEIGGYGFGLDFGAVFGYTRIIPLWLCALLQIGGDVERCLSRRLILKI